MRRRRARPRRWTTARPSAAFAGKIPALRAVAASTTTFTTARAVRLHPVPGPREHPHLPRPASRLSTTLQRRTSEPLGAENRLAAGSGVERPVAPARYMVVRQPVRALRHGIAVPTGPRTPRGSSSVRGKGRRRSQCRGDDGPLRLGPAPSASAWSRCTAAEQLSVGSGTVSPSASGQPPAEAGPAVGRTGRQRRRPRRRRSPGRRHRRRPAGWCIAVLGAVRDPAPVGVDAHIGADPSGLELQRLGGGRAFAARRAGHRCVERLDGRQDNERPALAARRLTSSWVSVAGRRLSHRKRWWCSRTVASEGFRFAVSC